MLVIKYRDDLDSTDLPFLYPCDDLNESELRIISCKDRDKKFFEFFTRSEDGYLEKNRILMPGVVIVDTTTDMMNYPYKSVSELYFVKDTRILYYYLGSKPGDILKISESGPDQDPFIYRNGNPKDVVFMYFSTIDDIINKTGRFRTMVPVFLKHKIKEDDGSIRIQTDAPYTLAQYVMLSTGETVENKCAEISRLHRLTEKVYVESTSSKVYVTCPFDGFFENLEENDRTYFMNVYIGTVWVSSDRYTVKYDSTYKDGKEVKKYYIEFNKGIDGKPEFDVKAGRSVYIEYFYSSNVSSKSPTMRMIDGGDIIRGTIPADRLMHVTNDINNTDPDMLVSALALKILRDSLLEDIQAFTGMNILHCNAVKSTTGSGDIIASRIIKPELNKPCGLSKRTGSTVYFTLKEDLSSNSYVIMENVFCNDSNGNKVLWGNDPIPIYLPDNTIYTYTEGEENGDLIPRYRFKAGQTIKLIYNTVMGTPRFYVNSGEQYRMAECTGIYIHELPITVEEDHIAETVDIYLSDLTKPAHITPAIEYLDGVDIVQVYLDGLLLVRDRDYTYHSNGRYIRVFNLSLLEQQKVTVKILTIRNL